MRRRKQRSVGVVGYVRVSSDEQASSGLGLAAQCAAIEAECERRGLPLLAVFEDAGASGKNLARAALQEALKVLDSGDASVLMVSRLDRLSRSVHDATGLMQRAERDGWGLVALDIAIDTTTAQGSAFAAILATFAELERKLIGERTRDALAVKRAAGVQLGRPRVLSDAVLGRIRREREGGASWSAIARALDADGISTAQGGKRWYPATVRAVYLSLKPDMAA